MALATERMPLATRAILSQEMATIVTNVGWLKRRVLGVGEESKGLLMYEVW